MIINGDCLDELGKIPNNSIDAIVTDPPYELNFMGKGWDNAGISFNKETWQKCLRVLKPGGCLLAFGGTRTYHRIACAIEDAGFEIRDCIMWLYGSGFPKSMNIGKAVEGKLTIGSANVKDIKKLDGEKTKVTCGFNATGKITGYRPKEYEMIKTDVKYHTELGKQWQGWGTALKPSYEPIIVARKPFKGSLVNNVMKYGVGGLNIDECRVEITDEKDAQIYHFNNNGNTRLKKAEGEKTGMFDGGWRVQKGERENPDGRFPANTILDTHDGEEWRRYFYCAKASKKDRDEGLDEFEKDTTDDGRNKPIDNQYLRGKTMRHNTHPTVKPTSLMQYLVRLVAPKGATILDPFMGSGSTGKAVMYENKERNANYKFIGIEKDAEYCKIAEARIKCIGGKHEN